MPSTALPQSTDDSMAKAIAVDDQAEAGVQQTFDIPKDFIDVIPEPKTASDKAAQVLGDDDPAGTQITPQSIPCPNRPNDGTGGFWDVLATVCESCKARPDCPSWQGA